MTQSPASCSGEARKKGCSILSREMGIWRSGWTYLLLPLFLLFVIGGVVEIAHPLEEARHAPHAHHEHSGTVYHEPLACETDGYHLHFCTHSQKLMPALVVVRYVLIAPAENAVAVFTDEQVFSPLPAVLPRAPPQT